MLKKILLKLKISFHYLMRGLNSGDKLISGNKDDVLNSGSSIIQPITQNNVWASLLKGEVTSEVKELRHMTYAVSDESKKYRYVGNGVVEKKKYLDEDHSLIDESDGLKIQLIQDNILIPETTLEVLKHVNKKGYKENEYTIKINRDFSPRFRVEEFTNKIVIKSKKDNIVKIELYISIYPSKYNRIHKAFISEMYKILNGDKRSDILSLNGLNFVTYKAFGSEDTLYYSYNNIIYNNCYIFDGHFILSFDANIVDNGVKLTQKYFDPNMDNKYKNKDIKGPLVVDFNSDNKTIDIDKAILLKSKLYKKSMD